MTGAAPSRFWRRVAPDHSPGEAPPTLPGDLGEAVRAACRRDDAEVGFRRNRELVDVRGQFRWLSTGQGTWVAKILPAAQARDEAASAARVSRALDVVGGSVRVAPSTTVPLGPGLAALVTPDLGPTLAEDLDASADWPAEGALLLRRLLEAGVLWHGLAPRNVVRDDAGWQLIDLDGVSEATCGTDRRDLHFWALDWCAPGGSPAELRHRLEELLTLAGVSTHWPAPDSYEAEVARVSGADDGRLEAARITELAWRPLAPTPQGQLDLTASETCRLLDDVLDVPDSVRALVALADLRRREGETAYAEALREVQAGIAGALRALGADRLVSVDRDGLGARVREGLEDLGVLGAPRL